MRVFPPITRCVTERCVTERAFSRSGDVGADVGFVYGRSVIHFP